MQTDPQHLKWKTDNDLKTAIISTILGQLAFSFLLVLNFIACLFRVLTYYMINFSMFLPLYPFSRKIKIHKKIKRFSDLPTLPHLRHVSGNKAIFILRLTLKNAKFCFDKSVNLGRLLIFDTTVLKINLRIFFYKTCFLPNVTIVFCLLLLSGIDVFLIDTNLVSATDIRCKW